MMEVFKDAYGGVIKVYDTGGLLNAKLGVESGLTGNIGGTLVLYLDAPYDTGNLIPFQRVEMGITSAGDGGATYRDALGRPRIGLDADSNNPIIGVANAEGNYISYLTPNAGYIGGVSIATMTEIANLYDFAANLIQNHIKYYHSSGTLKTIHKENNIIDDSEIVNDKKEEKPPRIKTFTFSAEKEEEGEEDDAQSKP